MGEKLLTFLIKGVKRRILFIQEWILYPHVARVLGEKLLELGNLLLLGLAVSELLQIRARAIPLVVGLALFIFCYTFGSFILQLGEEKL